MADFVDITAVSIRQTLLARAKAYAASKDCALSRIGDEAIRDSKFFARIEAGGNFTIETYQRIIDWLDAAERAADEVALPTPSETRERA